MNTILFWPLLTIEDSRDSCEHKKGDRIDLMSRSAKTAFPQRISQHWGQIIQQRGRLKVKTYNRDGTFPISSRK